MAMVKVRWMNWSKGDFRAALLMAGRNDGPILLRIWWENGKLTLAKLVVGEKVQPVWKTINDG